MSYRSDHSIFASQPREQHLLLASGGHIPTRETRVPSRLGHLEGFWTANQTDALRQNPSVKSQLGASIHPSTHYPPVHQSSVRPSVHPLVHPSICALSVPHPSTHPPIHLSIYLSIIQPSICPTNVRLTLASTAHAWAWWPSVCSPQLSCVRDRDHRTGNPKRRQTFLPLPLPPISSFIFEYLLNILGAGWRDLAHNLHVSCLSTYPPIMHNQGKNGFLQRKPGVDRSPGQKCCSPTSLPAASTSSRPLLFPPSRCLYPPNVAQSCHQLPCHPRKAAQRLHPPPPSPEGPLRMGCGHPLLFCPTPFSGPRASSAPPCRQPG